MFPSVSPFYSCISLDVGHIPTKTRAGIEDVIIVGDSRPVGRGGTTVLGVKGAWPPLNNISAYIDLLECGSIKTSLR